MKIFNPALTKNLLLFLSQNGFLVSQLGDSNAYELQKNKKSLITIGDYLPFSSQSVGIMMEDNKSILQILSRNDVTIKQSKVSNKKNNSLKKIHVYIDKDNYFQAIEEFHAVPIKRHIINNHYTIKSSKYDDISSKINRSIIIYCQKILKVFPGLVACSISMNVDNISKTLESQNYLVLSAQQVISKHYLYDVYKSETDNQLPIFERINQLLGSLIIS